MRFPWWKSSKDKEKEQKSETTATVTPVARSGAPGSPAMPPVIPPAQPVAPSQPPRPAIPFGAPKPPAFPAASTATSPAMPMPKMPPPMPRGASDSAAVPSALSSKAGSVTVDLPLSSIVPGIPPHLLASTAMDLASDSMASHPIALPLRDILPQLMRGRVVLPIRDLVDRFPQGILVDPLPAVDGESVILPLDELVAAIPPDYLALRADQQRLDLDASDLPNPFAEYQKPRTQPAASPAPAAAMPAPAVAPQKPAAPEPPKAPTQPSGGSPTAKPAIPPQAPQQKTLKIPTVPSVASAPAAQPPAEQRKPVSEPPKPVVPPMVPAAAQSAPPSASQAAFDRLRHLNFSLSYILDFILDDYIEGSKEDAGRKHGSSEVLVPIELIMSQLATGKVSLPLGSIMQYFPSGVLKAGVESELLILPLSDIVERIPAECFTQRQDQVVLEVQGIDIPLPFAEARPAPPVPKSVAPAPAPVQKAPEPVQPAAPVAVPISKEPVAAAPADDLQTMESIPLAKEPAISIQPVPEPAPTPIALKPEVEEGPSQMDKISIPVEEAPAATIVEERAEPQPAVQMREEVLTVVDVPAPSAEIKIAEPESAPAPAPAVEQVKVQEPVSIKPITQHEIQPQEMPVEIQGLSLEQPITQPPVAIATPDAAPVSVVEPASSVSIAPVATPDPVVEKVEVAPVIEPAKEPVAATPAIVHEAKVPVIPEVVEQKAPESQIVAPEPAKVEPPVEVKPEPVTASKEATISAGGEVDDGTSEDEIVVPEAARPKPVETKPQVIIDLNTVTAEELTQHAGITRSMAQRIIAFRTNKGGRFSMATEILQVEGMGRKTFKRIVGITAEAHLAKDRPINKLLGLPEDHDLNLREVIELTSKLPGLEGCMVAMNDGLILTGHLPASIDQTRLSAFGPELFKRVGQYVQEMQIGNVTRLTVFTDTQTLTILRTSTVFMVLVHTANRFSRALLTKCSKILDEISKQMLEIEANKVG